uniref:RHS repeat domain-containing protein n=1 Tax=Parachlamydia acanthamoebae TaxID=83552 RepID=UPI0024E1AE5F
QHLMEFRPLGHGRGAEIGAAVAFEIQGQVYIPLTNFTGHVQVLLNSKSEPVDIYRYTAFGEETIFDPSGDAKDSTTSWRFCSKRTDPETGLIYFGRRYYDPQIARWITADPLGYEAGPNLYAYVNNSPLTHIDIYGLIDIDGIYDEETRRARDAELGRKLKGMAHGTVDFAVETIHGLQTSMAYIGADEFCLEERRGIIGGIEESQTRQREIIDNKIMGVFNIDPSDEIYQSFRNNTKLGLEIWSLATGTYGAYKGIRHLNKLFKMSGKALDFTKMGTNLKLPTAIKENFFLAGEGKYNLDLLSKAGQVLDRNSLTKAGRALQKHGSRPGSFFPKVNGKASNINALGQNCLDDILTHPNSIIKEWNHRSFGEVINITIPKHGGARFSINGDLIGFLEP